VIDSWLQEAVESSALALPQEALGWVIGRGLPRHVASDMKLGFWVPPDQPSPDEGFTARNGESGLWREGWLVVPYWSPRGGLVGAEFRTWGHEEKKVRDYRTPSSKTTPTFIGLTSDALGRIWEGADVWLVEGLFDMSLYHVTPPEDVVLALGTARLTRLQLDFLHRFMSRSATVHVVFDEDETGRKQALGYQDPKTGKDIPGVVSRIQRRGMSSRHVRYRGGKDPGEIWEKGGKTLLRSTFNTYKGV